MTTIPYTTHSGNSLTHRLAAWRKTPVSVITSDQLNAALAAPPDPELAHRQVALIMTGLCADYGLDPDAARQTFGCDLLAAAVVAGHEHRPDVLTGQAERIRFFLSQPAVRNRLTPQHRPHVPAADLDDVVRINPDGSVVRRPLSRSAA